MIDAYSLAREAADPDDAVSQIFRMIEAAWEVAALRSDRQGDSSPDVVMPGGPDKHRAPTSSGSPEARCGIAPSIPGHSGNRLEKYSPKGHLGQNDDGKEANMILVTGATGSNGRELLKELAARGIQTTAMLRSGKDGSMLPDGIAPVEGDFDDEASLAAALEGVERAFLLTPSTERAEEQQKRFVQVAARAGVRHIVKLSQFAAAPDSPVRFLRYHAAVEAAIRDSGMDWTFLRPNLFMQGLLQLAGMVREQGMFAAPIGDARVSMVDVRDNAAVAAAALTEDGHTGRIYTLTGPEALTHAEVATRLSAATGRKIDFVDANDDQLRHAMTAVGMPDWQIEGLVEDYAHYARGEAAVISDGVQAATGQSPRNFDGFARDYADAFRNAGQG